MNEDESLRACRCHCGAVRFSVKLTDGFNMMRRCPCSYCRTHGAIAVSGDPGSVAFASGNEYLSNYQTDCAQHFFCSKCGVYTHHQRRSNPRYLGVNLACLDGANPFDLPEAPAPDDVTPAGDTGGPSSGRTP